MSDKKRILVVDDDEIFRRTVATLLSKDYELVVAENGRDAKNLIVLSPFDLIISDVQMPYLTGVELLQWVKEKYPTKFILMTGFSNIIETNEAHRIGADDFLAKPFSHQELLLCIKKLLEPKIADPDAVAEVPLNVDAQYCKIPIEDFVTDKEFQYDLFLRINENKYLKIAHKGGKVPTDRVHSYKDKGIHFFYISRSDFGQLVNFTMHFSKAVTKSTQIEKEKKERFVRYTGEMIVQQVFANGLNEASFSVARDFTNLCIETICEDSELLSLLENFNNHSDDLYAHSVAVATFSVMIAEALGWRRQSILFKLGMAGLFHDIGMKDIPKEIAIKPRAQLSLPEKHLLDTHPLLGKEILETLKNIPSDVVSVAYEHHENVLGMGYPRRIPRKQIHPLTHIVTVANIFSKYTVKNPAFPEPVSAKIAIIKMEQNYKDLMDAQSFEGLKSVVIGRRPYP